MICFWRYFLRFGGRDARRHGHARTAIAPLRALAIACFLLQALSQSRAGTLNGSFAPVPAGSVVDLTAEGAIDWVHWGLFSESALIRKAGVPPQISDLEAEGSNVDVFQYSDNNNGYSWSDGTPVAAATNTTTGVWAFGRRQEGSGFQLSVPADQTTRTLRVYVGVFAGVGRFSAFLTDMSAPAYVEMTLTNVANGPGRAYVFEYAADSPGQELILRWTLAVPLNEIGNVTLQAATLTAPFANNPPVVDLIAPTNNSSFSAGSGAVLSANAFDVDGEVSLVEFWDDFTKLGESVARPFNFSWTNVPAGLHSVTAKAIDILGATRSSAPVELFVNASGGRMFARRDLPASAVDLSAEGTLDWAHWGYDSPTSFNHKAEGASQIPNVVVIGTNMPQRYDNNLTGFSWTNGIPVTNAANITAGIFVRGFTNGFELAVPAETTLRRLKVYAGLYGARGNFQAFLTDFSAPVYADTSVVNPFGDSYSVYTIDYAAAAPGQSLVIRYRSSFVFDMDFGNVTLPAATLQELPSVFLMNPVWRGDGLTFSFATRLGAMYAVEHSDPLTADWAVVTNVVGTGETANVTSLSSGAEQGYYRVRTETGLNPQ